MTYSPPLGVFGNYIGVRISPGPWFVGTACPRSFDKWGDVAVVCGNVHKVETTYRGLSADVLSKLNKMDFFPGLLGNDILAGYDILFNLNSRKKKTDTEGIMYIGKTFPLEKPGTKVDLEFIGCDKIPSLSVNFIDGSLHRMIFETGSKYSYLESLEGIKSRIIGKDTDFVITANGPVVFEVELHEVTVSLGSATCLVTFSTEPGKRSCPTAVSKQLKTAHVQGILGWEILKHGPVAYLPRRGELWI